MWYDIKGVDELESPSLIFYKDRIEKNIDAMIKIAGDPRRLRPHVKTHKCPEIMSLQLSRGITKFKCATIAEAEMVALSGAADILLAYQPVGPTLVRFEALRKAFPGKTFSCLCDNSETARRLNTFLEAPVTIYIDLDCGMHRTGIDPEEVAELVSEIKGLSGLVLRGFHVYDGHLHISDYAERTRQAEKIYRQVEALKKLTNGETEIILGGSPTFPIHARFDDVTLSPGTTVLWDNGYGKMEGLDMFIPAALILTRVISHPTSSRYCLDSGHKAISAEHQKPPGIPGITDFALVKHSEEHMVIETDESLEIGQPLYLIPHHICPTVALYDEAVVVEDNEIIDRWGISARKRKINL